MQLTKHTVGRKVLMAITGQLMVLFALVHLLGNSSIFIGPNGINAYAEHLHSLGPLVWVFRIAMLTFLLVHGIFGIQTSLENRSANPIKYAVKKNLRANMASETMLYTGLLLFLFICYHLAQFTMRVTPDVLATTDAEGRFNVFAMVTNSFGHAAIALLYVVAMFALLLHLFHGIQSFFQTMGWNNENTLPVIGKSGRTVAVIVALAYISIPVTILLGIVK